MKKLFFAGLLALIGTGAVAQTSQGNISLGGSLSIYSASNDQTNSESKQTGFSISPSAGYFIKDGLELGLNSRLLFYTSTYKQINSDSGNKFNTFSYSIGPYLTKYISITEKLHLTATGGFGYENSRTKRPDEAEELYSSASGFYASAAPGLTYFATSKLGFSVSMGYIGYSKSTQTYHDSEPKQETVSEDFGLNFSPASASIGIRYYINR
ncbi:hypothetical protein ABID22_002328 [Pontibacter aydingkolensis]|uniref:Outer membrane beta-barrel protein n=1 Tax=Pontibacter aydingkolensis TaxID=1911536 RepID=A0ABS7CVV2_9BACT|nr:outer membrane beta-barrel protein [Pontibacter aydingkolensis]MBW7467930.1 outer membrane beta-barrel protein [Pontibacter aydingkolensis]